MASLRRAAEEAAADVQTFHRQRSGGSGHFASFNPDGLSSNYHPPNVRSQITEAPKRIDREKVCPLLLRVFIKFGGHHVLRDFEPRGREPKNELQIHTWKDATLRELAELIKDVDRNARESNARLSFSFVYPDRRGKNVMRQVGLVHSTRIGEDDHKTLEDLSFQTGDFLDVAVLL